MKNFILFLLLCSKLIVGAQQSGYWHLDNKQGLPTNTIYHITESKDGYIFLGTAEGLVKFNGFQFYNIQNLVARASDASALQVYDDSSIFFSNFNYEIFRYFPSKNKIEKLKNITKSNFNSQGKFILTLDFLYFYSGNTLYKYEINTAKLHTIFKTEHNIYNLSKSANEILITSDQLNSYEIYTGEIKSLTYRLPKVEDKPYVAVFNNGLSGILTLSLFANDIQIPIIDISKSGINYSINNICFTTDSLVWLCTSNGAYSFKINGKTITQQSTVLEGKNVSYVFRDSRRNYWVSTLNDGLFMLNSFESINYFFHTENHSINGISTLNVSDNQLYLGMSDGNVMVYEKGRDGFKKLLKADKRDIYLINKLNEDNSFVINSLYYKNIKTSPINIASLSSPKSLVALRNHIYYSNNHGFTKTEFQYLQKGIIDCDSQVYNFEVINDENKIIFKEDKILEKLLIEGRSNTCFLDSRNRIWISNADGIYILDEKNLKLTKLKIKYIENLIAKDFTEDNEGNIYIAVYNSGIYISNNQGTKKLIDQKNGLPDLQFRKLLFANNCLWITAKFGLGRYHLKNHKFNAYKISDGLLSNDINNIAYFDGKIWMATHEGLNSIPVSFNPSNSDKPLLYFTSLRVNNKKRKISNGQSYKLAHNENNIIVTFEGINYKSRNFLFYRYRLLGQSNDWIQISGNQNQLIFQGLPPGEYRLEIVAYNSKGLGSNVGYIMLDVVRPFWLSVRFWLLTGIAIVLLSLLIFRNNQIQRIKKNKLESELRLSQLSSLKAQMNPHFMFNSLNSIQDYILQNDKKSANMFLGKFSDLMRLILEMSNKNVISLTQEIKALNLYLDLEAMRFEDSFEYSLSLGEEIDPTEWSVPSMIIQPFIENAIKHGLLHKKGAKTLTVRIKKSEDTSLLSVSIEDNGIGRKASNEINAKKEKKYKSFATGATETRLQLLNREFNDKIKVDITDLYDITGNATGTHVKLTIPIILR